MTGGDSSHSAMFSLSQATLFIILQYDSSCNQRHTPNTAQAAFVAAAAATAAASSGHHLNTDL